MSQSKVKSGSIKGAGDRVAPYDAMVYQDGTYTIAVDGDGNVIKKVLTSANTDDVVIQAAIDNLTSGTVAIMYSTYTIDMMITIEDNVKLVFDHNTIVKPASDIDMFYVKNGSRISGCKIDVSNVVGYSSSCILINGSEKISSQTSTKNSVQIENIWFYNDEYTGNAIFFDSEDATSGYIYGVIIDKIRIYNFDYGIRFYRTGAYSTNWINGNTFSNIRASLTRKLIYMETDTGVGSDMDANTFLNIDFQSGGAPSIPVISIHGRYNNIESCMLYDWNVAWGPWFEFATNSNHNHAVLMAAIPSYYINNGTSTNSCVFQANGQCAGNYSILDTVTVSSTGKIASLRPNTITVGASKCDYTTLSAALDAITDASASNRYTIEVYGYISETSTCVFKSYIDVVGFNAYVDIDLTDSVGHFTIDGKSDINIRDITFRRAGTNSSGTSCLFIAKSSNVTLDNVTAINDVTSDVVSLHCIYVSVNCFNINIKNCYIVGGGRNTTTSTGYALFFGLNCTGTVTNTVVVSGIGKSTPAFATRLNSDVECVGCVFKDRRDTSSLSYTGGSYSSVPSATHPTYVEMDFTIYVTVAGAPGSKISLGTTDGGEEIGSVSCAETGYKYYYGAYKVNTLPVGGSLYFKPSDTNTRFQVNYEFGYNISDAISCYISTSTWSKFVGCAILSNPSSCAVYIASSLQRSRFSNCYIMSRGNYDMDAASLKLVQAENCTFGTGSLHNVLLPGRGTAATISAGDTYVDVTHNLNNTPTTVRVTPTTNLGTRSFWVDTKGASTFRININSSDSIDHTFDWEAEV